MCKPLVVEKASIVIFQEPTISLCGRSSSPVVLLLPEPLSGVPGVGRCSQAASSTGEAVRSHALLPALRRLWRWRPWEQGQLIAKPSVGSLLLDEQGGFYCKRARQVQVEKEEPVAGGGRGQGLDLTHPSSDTES